MLKDYKLLQAHFKESEHVEGYQLVIFTVQYDCNITINKLTNYLQQNYETEMQSSYSFCMMLANAPITVPPGSKHSQFTYTVNAISGAPILMVLIILQIIIIGITIKKITTNAYVVTVTL